MTCRSEQYLGWLARDTAWRQGPGVGQSGPSSQRGALRDPGPLSFFGGGGCAVRNILACFSLASPVNPGTDLREISGGTITWV